MRPQVGDIWEVNRPGKRKLVKEVGALVKVCQGTYPNFKHPWYVQWKRQPRGRYSGMLLKRLVQIGKRLSTLAERKASDEARWRAKGLL